MKPPSRPPRGRAFALVALVALALPSGLLEAQVGWDGPLMVSPASPGGWGLYLSDPSPGQGIAVMTTWRRSTGPGTGYRLGLAEGQGDRLTVFGGIDASGMLLARSTEFPLDMGWVAGGGLSVGEDILVSFPLGFTLGRDFEADGVWFNPNFGPRVVLDAWFGDDRPDRSLRLGFVVELGIDISFDPGWAVRFAGTLGDRDAVAIGISFRAF